ncbi:uncharacterized protein [Solanum lycopersicum]|uniref:uncharacterized protein n=1 Tax=Solanum lycopersicum TaxID=4081 RepID=UPI0002BCAB9F|nr:uncharacterized protein LOC101262438 [Solanum lycopersicum]
MVNAQRKDWSKKLDDAFCAYRTTYKTPIGTSPYYIIFGKACHVPAELENKAYWAIKKLNLDPELADRKRVDNLHELEEFKRHAYENFKLYKEKTKRWHNKDIVTHTFNLGEKRAVPKAQAHCWCAAPGPFRLGPVWSTRLEFNMSTFQEQI